MSHRPDQVASLIRRAVQSALARGLNDPRIKGLVSVTQVRVDHDLSHAAVSVSVLPAESGDLTVKGLQHAARRVQAELAKQARLRRVPHLSFHLDESIKKQAAFEEALAEGREGEALETESGDAESAAEEYTQ
jgi:ribosome-binding factor A